MAHSNAPGPHPTGTADPELSPFLGDWWNTEPSSAGYRRALVSEHDRGLCIQLWETDGAASDAGPAHPFHPQDDARVDLGMTATIATATRDTELIMNVKLGVLVIAAYHRYHDGRPARHAREFFRPRDQQSFLGVPADPLIGAWHNLHQASSSVTRLHIQKPAQWTVQAEVPALEATVHASQVRVAEAEPGTGFIADFNLDALQLRLTANINRGLLVVLTQWLPQTGHAWFQREFLARCQTNTAPP